MEMSIENKVLSIRMDLQNKWEDCLSSWIVLELFLVVPVFAQGPDRHLISSSQGEDCHRETLSHDGEADPGSNLASVVS